MATAAYYREQARQCAQISRILTLRRDRAELLRQATVYEQIAREAERAATPAQLQLAT
jgi:hypothetical protein